MKFSLPYWRKRRYLTGIDWTIGTLNHMSRRATGVGNLSQVVLEVEGRLEGARVEALLKKISQRLPVLHGRVARDMLNLAPYWKVPRDGAGDMALRVVEVGANEDAAAERLFADHVNTPLVGEREHLRFLLVHIGAGRSRLGMVFDHRLLDAFGAEAFLLLLEETDQGRLEEIANRVQQTEAAHLDEWGKRFACGRIVNQFRLRLAEREVVGVALPARGVRPVRFVYESLTPAETTRFIETAGEECGMPILLPSAVARALDVMRPVFADGGAQDNQEKQLLVAVSVDARHPERKWEDLLFNHLSFLGFAAPVKTSETLAESVLALREQFFEQMRQGIPAALQEVTMLTRICPQGIASRLARRPFGGKVCSFYFACLKESAYVGETFLGHKMVNLIHTPRVPPPPGVGICVTFFGGRMNLVFSYLEGTVGEGEARGVMSRFKSRLR